MKYSFKSTPINVSVIGLYPSIYIPTVCPHDFHIFMYNVFLGFIVTEDATESRVTVVLDEEETVVEFLDNSNSEVCSSK